MTTTTPDREVAEWNATVPVGAAVRYWPGWRQGEGIRSRTRSQAWVLGGHCAVVMVEGAAGGIALTHVQPVPASRQSGEAS